jgi:hypothetical protein
MWRVIVCLPLLAACTTHWVKPGASHADFNHDYYVCTQQASAANPTPAAPAPAYDPLSEESSAAQAFGDTINAGAGFIAMRKMCLKANGWTPQ